MSKDLPSGFDVSAHFLVDAITSASLAAGTMQDNIFTELRKEFGVVIGKTIDHTHLAVHYRQSREPDYVSHTVADHTSILAFIETAFLPLVHGCRQHLTQRDQAADNLLDLFDFAGSPSLGTAVGGV